MKFRPSRSAKLFLHPIPNLSSPGSSAFVNLGIYRSYPGYTPLFSLHSHALARSSGEANEVSRLRHPLACVVTTLSDETGVMMESIGALMLILLFHGGSSSIRVPPEMKLGRFASVPRSWGLGKDTYQCQTYRTYMQYRLHTSLSSAVIIIFTRKFTFVRF